MIYSEILLAAVKNIGLVEESVTVLDPQEKNLYAGYLRNAIAIFNNNPDISIGIEVLDIDQWDQDNISAYKRIVRNSYVNNPKRSNVGGESGTWLKPLIWNGVNGRSMQELPQRIISATSNADSVPIQYKIVNAQNFFESIPNSDFLYYEVNENEALVRVRRVAPMRLVFNRAVLFPWEQRPNESETMGIQHDPLDVHIQIPASHVPYLIALTSLETAYGQKTEPELLAKLTSQVGSQLEALVRTNIRDRVKTDMNTNFDYAFHFWTTRAYR